MSLIATWEAGPYLYQLWETETAFLCQCVFTPTLQTLWEGYGNTAEEACAEGVKNALRILSTKD